MSKEINNKDIFENESVFKTESQEYIEENSTIFTKKAEPVAKKKAGAGESKKRVTLIIVSLVLVVGIVFGIVGSVQLYNNLIGNLSNTSSELFGVYAVNEKAELLSNVTVNYNGKENVYVKTEGENTTSGETYTWGVYQVSSKLKTTLLKTYAEQFAKIGAVREVEMQDGTDYGFDKPNLIATVKFTDNTLDYVLTVGKQFSKLGEYYIKINDKCYVTTSAIVEEMFSVSTDFVDTTLFSAIDSDDVPNYYNQSVLTYFDYIDVKSTGFEGNLHITCNKNDPVYNFYKMTTPYERYVDPQYLDGFFSMFTEGLVASGAFTHTRTEAEIKQYGLDKPIASFIMKIGNYKIDMKIGAEIDGFYPVLFGDNQPIYKISVSNDSMYFVDSTVVDYVSTVTISDYITSISDMRFTFDGFDSTINLIYDKDDDTSWTASVKGNTINSDSVKHLYQHVLMIEPSEYVFEAEKGEVVLRIVLSYVDGSPDKVAEFTVYSEGTRRYVMWLDGEAQCIIRKDFVDNIIENLPKVVNGEYIKSPLD